MLETVVDACLRNDSELLKGLELVPQKERDEWLATEIGPGLSFIQLIMTSSSPDFLEQLASYYSELKWQSALESVPLEDVLTSPSLLWILGRYAPQKLWLQLKKPSADGKPLFHHMIESGNAAVMKLVTDEQNLELLTLRDLAGQTPLHIAVQSGQHECARTLLSSFTGDLQDWLSMKDFKGETALHLAAGAADSPLFQELLFIAPNPQKLIFETNALGESLLHLAAKQSEPEKLELLLNALPREKELSQTDQINLIDKTASTPFDHALRSNNESAGGLRDLGGLTLSEYIEAKYQESYSLAPDHPLYELFTWLVNHHEDFGSPECSFEITPGLKGKVDAREEIAADGARIEDLGDHSPQAKSPYEFYIRTVLGFGALYSYRDIIQNADNRGGFVSNGAAQLTHALCGIIVHYNENRGFQDFLPASELLREGFDAIKEKGDEEIHKFLQGAFNSANVCLNGRLAHLVCYLKFEAMEFSEDITVGMSDESKFYEYLRVFKALCARDAALELGVEYQQLKKQIDEGEELPEAFVQRFTEKAFISYLNQNAPHFIEYIEGHPDLALETFPIEACIAFNPDIQETMTTGRKIEEYYRAFRNNALLNYADNKGISFGDALKKIGGKKVRLLPAKAFSSSILRKILNQMSEEELHSRFRHPSLPERVTVEAILDHIRPLDDEDVRQFFIDLEAEEFFTGSFVHPFGEEIRDEAFVEYLKSKDALETYNQFLRNEFTPLITPAMSQRQQLFEHLRAYRALCIKSFAEALNLSYHEITGELTEATEFNSWPNYLKMIFNEASFKGYCMDEGLLDLLNAHPSVISEAMPQEALEEFCPHITPNQSAIERLQQYHKAFFAQSLLTHAKENDLSYETLKEKYAPNFLNKWPLPFARLFCKESEFLEFLSRCDRDLEHLYMKFCPQVAEGMSHYHQIEAHYQAFFYISALTYAEKHSQCYDEVLEKFGPIPTSEYPLHFNDALFTESEFKDFLRDRGLAKVYHSHYPSIQPSMSIEEKLMEFHRVFENRALLSWANDNKQSFSDVYEKFQTTRIDRLNKKFTSNYFNEKKFKEFMKDIDRKSLYKSFMSSEFSLKSGPMSLRNKLSEHHRFFRVGWLRNFAIEKSLPYLSLKKRLEDTPFHHYPDLLKRVLTEKSFRGYLHKERLTPTFSRYLVRRPKRVANLFPLEAQIPFCPHITSNDKEAELKEYYRAFRSLAILEFAQQTEQDFEHLDNEYRDSPNMPIIFLHRYLNEGAFERYLEKHGKTSLIKDHKAIALNSLPTIGQKEFCPTITKEMTAEEQLQEYFRAFKAMSLYGVVKGDLTAYEEEKKGPLLHSVNLGYLTEQRFMDYLIIMEREDLIDTLPELISQILPLEARLEFCPSIDKLSAKQEQLQEYFRAFKALALHDYAISEELTYSDCKALNFEELCSKRSIFRWFNERLFKEKLIDVWGRDDLFEDREMIASLFPLELRADFCPNFQQKKNRTQMLSYAFERSCLNKYAKQTGQDYRTLRMTLGVNLSDKKEQLPSELQKLLEEQNFKKYCEKHTKNDTIDAISRAFISRTLYQYAKEIGSDYQKVKDDYSALGSEAFVMQHPELKRQLSSDEEFTRFYNQVISGELPSMSS